MKKFYLVALVTLLAIFSFKAQIYLSEDFEGVDPPTGWPSNYGYTLNSNANPCAGLQAAQASISFFGAQTRHLQTPNLIAASDGAEIIVSFDYKMVGNVDGSTSVDYSVDDADAISGTGTWVNILTLTSAEYSTADVCQNVSITIPAGEVPSGSDFKLKISSTRLGAPVMFVVDNLNIYQSLTCFPLTDVTIDAITSSSVDFSWTAGPDMEGEWEYVVQAAGTGTPTSGTTTMTAMASDMTLQAATEYEIYVRGNCGDATTPDYSPWIGPVTFTTLCDAFTTTYMQSFDDTTAPEIDVCWNAFIDGSTSTSSSITGFTSTSQTQLINSAPNSIKFSNSSDTSGSYYLVSPEFSDLDATKRAKTFVYFDHPGEGDIVEIGVMTDPNDPTTYTMVQSYAEADLGGDTWVEVICPFDAYTFGTEKHIAIVYKPGGTFNGFYVDDFIYEPIPSCVEPTDLILNSVTDTTAQIQWTAENMESEWNYVIQAAGTGTPTSMGVSTTSNPLDLNMLMPNTDYEFYVSAVCIPGTDISDWTGPLTFRTECSAFTADHYENFNSLPNQTVDPCWSFLIANTSATGNYVRSDQSRNYPTTPGLSMKIYNGSDLSGDYFLISPMYSDLAGTSDKRVRFRININGDTDFADTYEVGLMTDPADDTTFTSLQTINSSDYLADTWSPFIIVDLGAATADQVYVAIKYNPEGTFNSVYIDEYHYEVIPDCLEPTDVVISEISDISATAEWTAAAGTTEWEYVFLPAGSAEPDDTTTGTTTMDNPVTDMSLSASTEYDFYVRTVCASGNSFWTGPIKFETKCAPEMVTYTEDFSSYAFAGPPTCWTEGKGGDATTGFSTSGPTASAWGPDGFNNAGTTGAAKLAYSNNLGSEWLISPLIDIVADGNYELAFDLGVVNGGFNGTNPSNFEGDDLLEVLISTDYGTTWTVLQTYDSSFTITDGVENAILDLTDYATNTIQIAFRGSALVDTGGAYDVFIDNFEVRPYTLMDYADVQPIMDNPAGTCQTITIAAQGTEPGITDTTPGVEDPTLSVWIAVSDADTDPSTWDEALWMAATYNPASADDATNDEYTLDAGPLAAGTYYVASRWQVNMDDYVYGGDGGIYDGTTIMNMELVVEEPATITASVVESTICEGGEAVLSATSDDTTYTYEWDNGGGSGDTVTVMPTATTTYTVTGTNENGCMMTAMIEVVVNPAPDAPTAESLQQFCTTDAPTEADLVATPSVAGNTIEWYDAATDGNLLSGTALVDGAIYYAGEVSADGCASLTRTIVIVNLDDALCAPENDDCANAEMLTVEAPAVPGNTTNATLDAENTCDATMTGNWYTVTGDGADLTVTVTPSSGWDPSLSVMTGDCTGGFTCLDEGVINNGGDGEVEAVTFPSDAGVVYYIMTGSPSGASEGEYAIQVTSNLGIEDIANIDNSIALYPNPVVDVLYMNTEQEIAVAQVFALDGSLVKEITNLTDNAINVHSLNQGTYILRVILADHTVVTEKFIKR